VIAPSSSAEFVAALEEVLEVYERAPGQCAAPGLPGRMHPTTHPGGARTLARRARAMRAPRIMNTNEGGVAAIFCAVAPHLGWRHLEERERKTRRDYAGFLRALCDEHFPAAERIVLVQDNLNTHSPASLYEAFPPAEAARIKARFELHFTPKHGSWLNIAEIALSALARGCLARRIPDRGTLAQELRAWQRDRNQVAKGIRWQFTTADARVKLIKLYPSPQK
jgi:hypothetical protein